MTLLRTAYLGLLALLIGMPAWLATEATAAQPNARSERTAAEDDSLDSARGEIEEIITPEYRQRGMRVERLPNGNLRIRLPSEVLFAYDSADISRDFAPTLRQVARIMSRRPRLQANITGHTDNAGSDPYNLDLSLRRAESVSTVLRSEGVENFRLHTDGRGKREPIATNATAEGRQLNRRVEITLFRQRADRPRRVQP
ncbi:MAG TPA: OmpA family protein [Candidatus Competibacter sp.]|nr:hypothetical protein [Candidatus Competibacteraceae bacterium]HRE53705.1 OmpA family protein [Candidatus Competibacter sp.]HUM93581.1 OmpA family protein [Candidatus Competibacter sp.]